MAGGPCPLNHSSTHEKTKPPDATWLSQPCVHVTAFFSMPSMSDLYAREVLRVAVAQLCLQKDFASAESDAKARLADPSSPEE